MIWYSKIKKTIGIKTELDFYMIEIIELLSNGISIEKDSALDQTLSYALCIHEKLISTFTNALLFKKIAMEEIRDNYKYYYLNDKYIGTDEI